MLSRIHENLTINYVLEIKSSESIKLRKATGTQHRFLRYLLFTFMCPCIVI